MSSCIHQRWALGSCSPACGSGGAGSETVPTREAENTQTQYAYMLFVNVYSLQVYTHLDAQIRSVFAQTRWRKHTNFGTNMHIQQLLYLSNLLITVILVRFATHTKTHTHTHQSTHTHTHTHTRHLLLPLALILLVTIIAVLLQLDLNGRRPSLYRRNGLRLLVCWLVHISTEYWASNLGDSSTCGMYVCMYVFVYVMLSQQHLRWLDLCMCVSVHIRVVMTWSFWRLLFYYIYVYIHTCMYVWDILVCTCTRVYIHRNLYSFGIYIYMYIFKYELHITDRSENSLWSRAWCRRWRGSAECRHGRLGGSSSLLYVCTRMYVSLHA
jgi:hypothetical protein